MFEDDGDSFADMAVSGLICSGCGAFFEKEHGYPVLCKDCWKEWTPSEREGYQEAIFKELTGDE